MAIHDSFLGKELIRITGKKSAEQVAKVIDICPAQLSRIFSGKGGISSKNLKKLLDLGVSPESIPELPAKENTYPADIRFPIDLLEIVCNLGKEMNITHLSLKEIHSIKSSCEKLGFFNPNLVREMLKGII